MRKRILLPAVLLLSGSMLFTGCVNNVNADRAVTTEAVSDDIEQFRTPYVGDNTKVVGVASHLDYPEGLKYDHIEILSEKEPYGLNIYVKKDTQDLSNDAETALLKSSDTVFDLIGNVQTLTFMDASNNETIAEFQRDPFAKITDYFDDPHKTPSDDPNMLSASYDINGDGSDESIYMIDAGVQGGDGGYTLYVEDAEGNLLYSADDYRITAAFSKDDGVLLTVADNELTRISPAQLEKIYSKKESSDKWKNYEDGFTTDGDYISGFTIDKDTNTIITKSLVSGTEGHADTLGYVLSFIKISKDGQPDVSYGFAVDE
ncbi:protein of unknown function [Lachnospiraceae bacterium]|nr:protein of unknown function [Lachnospiraceae bacterium]